MPLPVDGPLESALPACVESIRRRGVHGGLESPIEVPRVDQFLAALPEARRQAGQERSPSGRGLGDLRTEYRDLQNVRLELHQEIVADGATIHLDLARCDA